MGLEVIDNSKKQKSPLAITQGTKKKNLHMDFTF
jgi:hypothetical protein